MILFQEGLVMSFWANVTKVVFIISMVICSIAAVVVSLIAMNDNLLKGLLILVLSILLVFISHSVIGTLIELSAKMDWIIGNASKTVGMNYSSHSETLNKLSKISRNDNGDSTVLSNPDTLSKLSAINVSNDNDRKWLCENCGFLNDNTSMLCKDCGKYK